MKSPFKFLDAYTQEDIAIFFGREEDTEKLYNALTGVKHLLVYGPSGAGKTSLIECGLRNQFSDADWYALSIRKGKNINESVFTEINKALRNKLPQDDTQDFTELVENLFAERYQPVYLLFDQFEELLILGEKEEKETFFKSINQLIRYKVPCRILFIMREEFIGHLSEFEPLCPTLFQNRHRVEKMNRSNVQTVIQEMLDAPTYQTAFSVQESESLAQKILSKLPDAKKEIELAHVQVFLSELWDKAKEKAPQNALPLLQENLIETDDNLETILDSFLKKQLSKMEEKFPKKAPLEVLAVMISERHTKLQLSEKEIEKELSDKSLSLDNQQLTTMLNLFEQSRILRKLGSEENIKYEITHDVLASAVGQNLTDEMKLREKAKDIYRVYEEREGFFSQEDIDYMRPYQVYRAYPAKLEKRIRESEENIQEIQEAALNKAKEIANKEAELRETAEDAQAKAKKRSRIAITVAVLAVITSLFAYLQYKKAETQTEVISAEQAKNKKIIASSFFYANRFGLAVRKDGDETKYGFIDKEGNERISYEYSYAQPFDERTGLALVKKKEEEENDNKIFKEQLYFIDTLQNEYPLAYEPTTDNSITALDLRGKNLKTIPAAVFQMRQLKVLLLGNNQLTVIPPQMKELSNLVYLNLHWNPIRRLENLENLGQLICFDISGDETEGKKGNIRKLEGLNNLKNLKAVNISKNQINKLEGLDNLKNLRTFDISENQINKLERLDNLKNLQTFNISENQINKLEGLDNLKNLQTFNISENQISKLEGIDNLKNLQTFDISSNQINKLEGLDNLKDLLIFNISDNQILKLEGLDNLKNLQTFNISGEYVNMGGKISKLEGLDNLENLQEFDISSNQIGKLEGLDNLKNLKNLNVFQNQISKLEGLDNLKNLQTFNINMNQISKLEGLDNLKNLREFDISYNEISKLEKLNNLKSLREFDIFSNQISKLEGLDSLKNLQEFGISGNEISKLEGLKNLKNLHLLHISDNQISKLEGLDNLKNLQDLYIFKNQISKLEGLDNLKNLQNLDVLNNQISKLEGLDNLENLQSLDISGNEISEEEVETLQKQHLTWDIITDGHHPHF